MSALLITLTGCGQHTVTTYAPPESDIPKTAEQDVQEEPPIPETEIINALYFDENIIVRFSDSMTTQSTFYLGLSAENRTEHEASLSLSGIALDGRMIPTDAYTSEPVSIAPDTEQTLSIDLDLQRMEVLFPGFTENAAERTVSFTIALQGTVGENTWMSEPFYVGEYVEFPNEEQIDETYNDNDITVYSNGETRPGHYNFVVRNKTMNTLTISVRPDDTDENSLDYYLLDNETMGSAAVIGDAYESIDVTMPIGNDEPIDMTIIVESEDGMHTEVPVLMY